MTETVTMEKQVWESTLNRSMVLQAENAQLKKWCEEFNALNVAKENRQLKELLKECKRQFEEVELYRCDVADTDQEDWFKISTEQASVANKMITKINQALGENK